MEGKLSGLRFIATQGCKKWEVEGDREKNGYAIGSNKTVSVIACF